ncbi:MAG: alpha/beta hydrolase [Myxococcota bacterium]|nr:alpha/beta hydrolase [Myxococcota bacterium]
MGLLWFVLACAGGSTEVQDTQDSQEVSGPVAMQTLTLTTRDEVQITTDYYGQSSSEVTLVVFAHMNPSAGFNRTDWPTDFLESLHESGLALMVLDRRGAGDSEGMAADAYNTVKGAYDLEACVLRAQADGFDKLLMVGASNGSTSVLDYASLEGSEAWPALDGFMFLSPGNYTQANHDLSAIAELPGWVGFPTSEAANADDFEAVNPDWPVVIYDPGSHGTQIFGVNEQLAVDMEGWLTGQ